MGMMEALFRLVLFCHLCVQACGLQPQLGPRSVALHGGSSCKSPGLCRADQHPAGLPAKDTASQPGHTAQNGARAVLMRLGKLLPPSCLLATFQAREVVGQPDPAGLTSLFRLLCINEVSDKLCSSALAAEELIS